MEVKAEPLEMDFNKVCRTCLKENLTLVSVFTQVQSIGHALVLADMLMTFANVEIQNGGNLPNSICTECVNQIDRAYSFKLLCEQSETSLRQYIEKPIRQCLYEPIKEETCNIEESAPNPEFPLEPLLINVKDHNKADDFKDDLVLSDLQESGRGEKTATQTQLIGEICKTREDFGLMLPEIISETDEASSALLPNRSKNKYEAEFDRFEAWMAEKNVTIINETVLLAYFNEKSKEYQCSSLWTKYSMIKKMLLVKKNLNISSYRKLLTFLKNKSVGYEAKKGMALSKENVIKFITEAPDDMYLLIKVALIFRIYGGCRREELASMSVNSIEDRGSVIVVTIPKTKTNKKRVFTVVDEEEIPALMVYKKYAALRPANVEHSRFFVLYKNKACTKQPVGKNTFGAIPKTIAKYLNLPNPEKYTGHTFRRKPSTLRGNS